MFPCEFCEISESTLSTEHLGTTASKKSEASICFKNVFLSEAAFTDYCWQELTIFGSYLETFSQETHTKFCLSQLIVSAVNPINLFPLWGRGGGVILPSLPHSNFLKKFRKYKLVCAVLLWLSIYIYLTYSEKFSGFCSSWKSGRGYFVGNTWKFSKIYDFVQIPYF